MFASSERLCRDGERKQKAAVAVAASVKVDEAACGSLLVVTFST
jgi:hypothetical protein